MEDKEIIKALECCTYNITQEKCDECPLYSWHCTTELAKNALDLINRQKAEIERLKDEVKEKTETITFLKDQAVGWSIDFCNLKEKLDTAKAEAVKEFAEKLKEQYEIWDDDEYYFNYVTTDQIDNLLKEMVGVSNADK